MADTRYPIDRDDAAEPPSFVSSQKNSTQTTLAALLITRDQRISRRKREYPVENGKLRDTSIFRNMPGNSKLVIFWKEKDDIVLEAP